MKLTADHTRIAAEELHPHLNGHLDSGTIWSEEDMYYGRSFGQKVQVGTVGEEDIVEAYLEDHPDPEDW